MTKADKESSTGARVSTLCYAFAAREPRGHLAQVWAELERAHRYKNTLVEQERIRRNAWDAIVNRGDLSWWAVAWKLALDEAAKKAVTEKPGGLRKRRGCSWGTGGLIEEAARTAGCVAVGGSRKTDPPQFQDWEHAGRLGVQLQGGLSVEDLRAGTDSQARLMGSGKWRQLHLRLSRNGEWLVWPVIIHREFPEGARVKMIRIHTHRVATRQQWSAQFVIDLPPAVTPPKRFGTVGVDIGWRLFDTPAAAPQSTSHEVWVGTTKLAPEQEHGDTTHRTTLAREPERRDVMASSGREIRVASWADDSGTTGELRLPASILGRWRKTEDLQSIRIKNFNAAIKTLCAHREELPPAQREEATYAHAWRSPEKLAGFVRRWEQSLRGGSAPAITWTSLTATPLLLELSVWAQKNEHLWLWEAHERRNVLLARREIYRLFARFLADTYGTIVFEHLDLREFAEHPGEDDPEESWETKGARPQRFKVALSELRTCAERAVKTAGGEWVKAPAAWTTQTCAECGEKELFDAAKKVLHTCSHCLRTWDQDLNAARNLLRAATSRDLSAPRSQPEVSEKPKKRTAVERRAAGLATRRGRRSKDGAQPPEVPGVL